MKSLRPEPLPYSAEQWLRIVDTFGAIDDLASADIRMTADEALLKIFLKSQMEPHRRRTALMKLSNTLSETYDEFYSKPDLFSAMSDALPEVYFGSERTNTISEMLKLLKAFGQLAADAAKRQNNVSVPPRTKPLVSRNKALTNWASIFETKHGRARGTWNEMTGKSEGKIVSFLIACASPIYDRITAHAILGFLKEKYDPSSATLPLFHRSNDVSGA